MVYSSYLLNTPRGQDYIIIGHCEDFSYYIIFDGHGSDTIIDFIRTIPEEIMNKIMEKEKSIEEMQMFITVNANLEKTESSGSTMCGCKIYSDKLILMNCGDSHAICCINDDFFKTDIHDYTNENEVRRVKALDATFENNSQLRVIDETTIESIPGYYTVFSNGRRIKPTQVLGHSGVTGTNPFYRTFAIEDSDKIQIIIGSDGLWDMICDNDLQCLFAKNAKEIAEFAYMRWTQPWNYLYEGKIYNQSFPRDNIDDISVIKIKL